MNPRFIGWIVFSLALLAIAADVAWLYPQMPERMATHFNAAGAPDGWSGRSSFLLGMAGTVAFMAVLFGLLAWLLPLVPVRFVNVPHRDYWLAPSRQAATLATLQTFLLLLGAGVVLLTGGTMHGVFIANLRPDPRLGRALIWFVGLEVVFVLATLGWIVWRFRRPQK